jgi:hypothetical protein
MPSMTHASPRRDGQLASIREPRVTLVRATLWSLLFTLVACGGGHKKDTYGRGVHVQEECCEHLKGGDRDACLQKIVRVDDPEVAKTRENQQTYACVVEHFTCDPATGHATSASVQAQMDCEQDLQ